MSCGLGTEDDAGARPTGSDRESVMTQVAARFASVLFAGVIGMAGMASASAASAQAYGFSYGYYYGGDGRSLYRTIIAPGFAATAMTVTE